MIRPVNFHVNENQLSKGIAAYLRAFLGILLRLITIFFL
ncbi:hypothetical protein RV13_GL002157 [Enterococcus raffinosus]|nr:hypothetical protein RV13_GL002157 [Enterococcus raffinosus]